MDELKKYLENKSSNKNITQVKKVKKFPSFLSIFLIFILIIGAGLFFLQKTSLEEDKNKSLDNLKTSLQEEIDNLKEEIDQSQELNEELSQKNFPLVEILTTNDYCLYGFEEDTELEIKINGEFVAQHNIAGCFDDPEIVAIYNDSAYFAFQPEAAEDYYIYSSAYLSLYRLNLEDYSLEDVFLPGTEDNFSKDGLRLKDIDFSEEKLVYNGEDSIIIYDLDSKIKELYDLPMKEEREDINCRQFGDFKFSYNGQKVALAIAYPALACEEEVDLGQIYVFDLEEKTFTLQEEENYFMYLHNYDYLSVETKIINFN